MAAANPRKLPPLGSTTDSLQGTGQRPRKKRRNTDEPGTPGSEREPRPRSNSRSRATASPSPRDSDQAENVTPRPRKRTGSTSRPQPAGTDADTTQEAKPRRVKKKKPAEDITTSREPLVAESPEGAAPAEQTPRKKKRRKPKARATSPEEPELGEDNIGLAADLSGLNDDVVTADRSDEKEVETAQAKAPALRSEPVGRLFIEQRSGFKSADKAKIARRRAEEEIRRLELENVKPTTQTTIQLGLASHRVFKTFSLFCHGILAGFALWHIISVYTLYNVAENHTTFLKYYQPVAMPVQSLYYILFAICTVSVFDRYDIGRPTKREFLRCITMQSGGITTFIYFTALVFSLSIAATDDKIWLYGQDGTLWTDQTKASDEAELAQWRILNVIRGVGAILGWLVISIKPHTDRLTENLESADENILGEMGGHPDVVQSSGV